MENCWDGVSPVGQISADIDRTERSFWGIKKEKVKKETTIGREE